MEVLAGFLSVEFVPVILVAAFASVLIVVRVIKMADSHSAASTRRILGLFVVATAVWILPVIIGSLASPLLGSTAIFREFIFGAFLAWAFELIVINGVFLSGTVRSITLAAVHPIPILVIVAYVHTYQSTFPVIFGIIALLFAVAFLLKLKGTKTKNGIASLQLLRAFLKTWVVHEPSDLENSFLAYAKKEPVHTDIFLFKNMENETALILPGIHPGPFSPVGSYNLSELIYRAVRSGRTIPVVLHGIGGHERNAPTNNITFEYAREIKELIDSANVVDKALLKGPFHFKIDITNITVLSFGKSIIAMVTDAPYRSDDLDPATVAGAIEAASELGLKLSIVDAHNSVDGKEHPQTKISIEDWRKILNHTISLNPNELNSGFAHSSEIDFKHGLDISEGGIGVFILSTGESKGVLVTADSNNAISILRQRLEDSLHKAGFELIELCTSDTHNFAARNLTERGYFALGESTEPDLILNTIERLVRIAEKRIAPCEINLLGFDTEIALIGQESLDDFAALTKKTTLFAKSYVKIMIPALIVLLGVTLFY